MFLSIIIPIYNDERFLAECLDSCLAQDIPYDDYEIICIDDGSTDRTPEILADYAGRFPNVLVISKEHGKGAGRNIGLESAKGDFVWFVDHDDIVEQNVLLQLKNIAGEGKSDRIVFSCYEFFYELTPSEQKQKAEGTLAPNGDNYMDSVVWTSIINRAFLLENGVLPSSVRLKNKTGWGTDTLFIYELKQHDIRESRIEGKPFYFYRRYAGAQTSTYTKEFNEKRFYGSANIAMLLLSDYHNEVIAEHRIRAADLLMIMLRRCTEQISKSVPAEYREKKKFLKENGLFPMKAPKESSYQRDYFWKEKNGKSRLYNMLRFYSTASSMGLFALSLSYRFQRLKIKLSHAMRKNKLLNRLLDLKNKIVRR